MNRHSKLPELVAPILLCLVLIATNTSAQDSGPPPRVQSTQPVLTAAPDSTSAKKFEELERDIQNLKKPQKDGWDKLAAISGLISGGVVVLLGLLVTYVVSERNRVTAEQQKNRELAVLQVQTVQSFMPQLQAGGPKEVEAALLAIFALDKNSSLATDLASLYRNEGAISALRKIASGPSQESAKVAREALASWLTVSLKRFSPDLEDLRLSAGSVKTFYDLTNEVFWGLKGAVKAFAYEKSWILRDLDTQMVFRKQRTEDNEPVRFDFRTLEEVGIEPGMALEAVPANADNKELFHQPHH